MTHSKPHHLWPTTRRFLRWKGVRWWLGMAAALCANSAMATTIDDVTTTAVKRFYLIEANNRCHVFDAATTSALKAAYIQARNEAIRNGYDMSQLGPWIDKARAAADSADCAAPQLTAQVDAAKGAFRRFMAMTSLDLPTGRTQWSANRAFGDNQAWRLVQYQDGPQADLAMGIYGRLDSNRFSVMAHFKDGAVPYSAHLLVRDPAISAVGVINPAAYGLSNQMPVGFTHANSLSFMARSSSQLQVALRPQIHANLAGFSLTGDFVGVQAPSDAIRFDFPTSAYRAIAQLDPREDIVVVFDFSDGPRYARFEVGDFIAGLTYVALPTPYTHYNSAN